MPLSPEQRAPTPEPYQMHSASAAHDRTPQVDDTSPQVDMFSADSFIARADKLIASVS